MVRIRQTDNPQPSRRKLGNTNRTPATNHKVSRRIQPRHIVKIIQQLITNPAPRPFIIALYIIIVPAPRKMNDLPGVFKLTQPPKRRNHRLINIDRTAGSTRNKQYFFLTIKPKLTGNFFPVGILKPRPQRTPDNLDTRFALRKILHSIVKLNKHKLRKPLKQLISLTGNNININQGNIDTKPPPSQHDWHTDKPAAPDNNVNTL